jgi:hypothetical protein
MDPLIYTSLVPPLIPLGLIMVIDGFTGPATWSCITVMILSIFYHGTEEKCFNLIEPMSVHVLFIFLLIYFRTSMQWSIYGVLCLLCMFICYWKGSGRGAREHLKRKWNYICYHSWFHVFACLFFTITLWTEAMQSIINSDTIRLHHISLTLVLTAAFMCVMAHVSQCFSDLFRLEADGRYVHQQIQQNEKSQ